MEKKETPEFNEAQDFMEFDSFEKFDPDLLPDEVLEQKCIYQIKPVADKLNLSTTLLRREHELHGSKETGIINVMGSWLVRMPIFKEFYLKRIKNTGQGFKIGSIPGSVKSIKDLLNLPGIYRLAQVISTGLLPFPEHRITHFIKAAVDKAEEQGETLDTRQEFGVWMNDFYKVYVVEMPVFSKWIKRVWAQSIK